MANDLVLFNEDVRLMIDQTLSPQAQSLILAQEAIDLERECARRNEAFLGRALAVITIVDGIVGALESSVKPNGIITYEFNMVEDVITFVAKRLHELSPVGSGSDKHPGLYQSSHRVYADGVEVNLNGKIPSDALEYVFLNPLPYALRIEQGESPQADQGVYELVSMEVRQQFGDAVYVEYNLRSPINADRYTSVGQARNRYHRAAIDAQNAGRVPSILIRQDKRTLH